MTAKKRTPKPADPAKLAGAFVNDRLAFLSNYTDFTDSNPDPDVRTKFNAIVEAVLAEDWPNVTRDMVLELAAHAGPNDSIHEDTPLANEEAHARAGFLVGLELGRRLGGAR